MARRRPVTRWRTATSCVLGYGACAAAERVRFESFIRCRSTFLEGALPGEQVCAVFYDGVDDDPLRQAVGLSCAGGAIQAFVTDLLSGPYIEHVIKEPILKSVRNEASDLLPHLKALNAGGLPMPTASPRMTGRLCSSASARMFMCWIRRRSSLPRLRYIRGLTISLQPVPTVLMMISGSNDLSHNSQVYEKCLRAHVDHRKFDKEAFMAMMVKRFDGVKAPVL